jgi:dihydroxyacetone kinase
VTAINILEHAMTKSHPPHHSPALKKIRLMMSGAIVGISIANIAGANVMFQEYAEFIGASLGALLTAVIVRGF